MYYEEKTARELVLKAGLELVERKLIARTWGNISARISKEEFIITPSGRAYEDLGPEDLVKVKAADCSYEGTIRPSSEKMVHAAIYNLHGDAAFVIHTHQLYATAVSVEETDPARLPEAEQLEGIGTAPCAAYALAGTEELKEAVAAAVREHAAAKAFLMTRHGAICFGKDAGECFEAIEKLEEDCRKVFEKRVGSMEKAAADPEVLRKAKKPWLDDYAQIMGYFGNAPAGEDEEALKLIREKNTAAAAFARKARPMGFFDVLLQNIGYRMKYSKLKKTNR